MSGGMDSAVAATLLKNQGFELQGIYFQMVPPGEKPFGDYCSRCACHKLENAKTACHQLDIPLQIFDAHGPYHAEVIDHLVHASLQQKSQRSCLKCHKNIIFKLLLQRAKALGCQQISTGHYAQIVQDTVTGQSFLSKAADAAQDQSHLLYDLDQETLNQCIFPLGTLSHSMVEKLAHEMGIEKTVSPAAAQNVAQTFCFRTKETYIDYVTEHSAQAFRSPGIIRTTDGSIVGEHEGLFQFSIGQHEGMKLSGTNSEPLVVVSFEANNQALIVGARSDLLKAAVTASEASWIRPVDAVKPFRCEAKIIGGPHPSTEGACRVTVFENNTVKVEFDEPRWGLAPGQSIVFYEAGEVLGGAVIERTEGTHASVRAGNEHP